MENKGLLFIPDISGFTRFVNETDIDHSRLIIQELLEILINSNQLGLEVSEIEGDAILFYKFGDSPRLEDLYQQVAKMFCAFHQHLTVYDLHRFCYCKACNAAAGLTLKIITHYGEFTGYNVKNFNKLIGKDVIVAHQLLKNDIDQHEYWLVTKNLVPGSTPAGFAEWMEWNRSSRKTEGGEVSFHYTQLGELKKEIPSATMGDAGLPEKQKVLSLSREYDTDIISLFHASGDFRFRHKWQEGIKSVEEVSHFLPRVGMRCRCIMENGEAVIYASSYSYSEERISFSETDEKTNHTTTYLLEKLGPRRTRLQLDYYRSGNWVSNLFFNKQKKKKSLQQSLLNLDQAVKELEEPALN